MIEIETHRIDQRLGKIIERPVAYQLHLRGEAVVTEGVSGLCSRAEDGGATVRKEFEIGSSFPGFLGAESASEEASVSDSKRSHRPI